MLKDTQEEVLYGCEHVDVVEDLAIERAKELSELSMRMFSLIPVPKLIWQYFCNVKSWGYFMGMNLSHGGHLSHGMKINMSGKYFNVVPYGVREDTCLIDYDQLRQIAVENKPKMIIAGASAYSSRN